MDKPQILKQGYNIQVQGEEETLSRNESLKKAAEALDREQDKTVEDSFPASDPPSSGVSD